MSTACGLTNLATCLPEMFFEFVLSLINSSLQPLLDMVNYLMTEPVVISMFEPMWAVMAYVLSLFYGLFFLFAGFNLMISGYKRETAKEWLANVVLMVIFVQGSYFLYELIIELASLLTSGVMNIIDPDFFLFTIDSYATLGLQLGLMAPYSFMLTLTVLLLALRYLFVVIGVVFMPFAMFFYFIPPLKAYGKLILNVLLVLIFVPFFDAVFLFGASALLNIPLFANFNIILSTVAFFSINLIMLMMILFAILKAAFSIINSDIGRNVKKAVRWFV